jgi:hypothetical protein
MAMSGVIKAVRMSRMLSTGGVFRDVAARFSACGRLRNERLDPRRAAEAQIEMSQSSGQP